MSQTIPPQAPRRWPLYVSLFLNVVLITVLVVGAWRIHQVREGFGGPALGGWLPRQVERVLPAEAAARVRAIREARADEVRALFRTARAARDDVRQAFNAEPLDAAALTAALTAMREADGALSAATAGMIVEIAATLSPAERQLVRENAREFRKRPGRGPGREGRGERRPPPPDDMDMEPPPGEIHPPDVLPPPDPTP